MKFEKCPKCGSENIILSGKAKGKQRYHCKDCKFYFSKELKVEPVSLTKANRIYEHYLESSISKYALAKAHGLKPVELQRWFNVSFWKNKEASNNKFKQVAIHNELTSDITNYLKPFRPKIRVKPQFSNVIIQYLHRGHETNPKFSSVLFTLYDFTELFGENFCAIKFNFLENSKNKLGREKLEVYLNDFLPKHYSTKIHSKGDNNTLKNVKISDFLDEILSHEKMPLYLNLFMEQKNEDIKRQIEQFERMEANIKIKNFEKIQKIRDRRNKV